MTIGSSYDYPAHRAYGLASTQATPQPANPWAGRFPNPPDLCFNYKKLVDQPGIATATQPNHKIGIIGAGITGLTAARELFRCGFNDITIIEANSRIGGRHLTITDVANQGLAHDYSPFEMAAMRMPYFNTAGEHPNDGMSLLAYYSEKFCLSTENFPNPGTRWVTSTGIYLQEGLLPTPDPVTDPRMLIWKNADGSTPPPTTTLQEVQTKWKQFERLAVDAISSVFGSSNWEAMWNDIVNRYSNMPFRDMVKLPLLDKWDPSKPGYFGGLGLTEDQSALFYAIGFGDGSWGAFYDVCAIYPIRTALFGFGSQLQLIHGRYTSGGQFNPGPYSDKLTLPDPRGVQFDGPKYRGVKTFDDCMLFLPVPERDNMSFYDYCIQRKGGLITSAKAIRLEKQSNGQNRVYFTTANQQTESLDFDSLIITVPSWILEVTSPLEGFTSEMMPPMVTRAYKTAHWETSCKVYAPLKPEFFTEPSNKIPPILVTDSFVHDVYAYKYGIGDYKTPCILISYTWEDDATKLASFDDKTLVDMCVNELDRILMRSNNVQQKISPYILKDFARIERWVTDPYALGCAKLYRAGAYGEAMSLLAYNRECSAKSGLYLSGESFSVDAGWTEPSLRGAVDAVINICHNTNAKFAGEFTMDVYPKYVVPQL